METCCGLVVVLVIGYVVIQIIMAASNASEDKMEKIKGQKNDIDREINKLNSQLESLKQNEVNVVNYIKSFFTRNGNASTYVEAYDVVTNTISKMNNQVISMETTISSMKKANDILVGLSHRENQSGRIAQEKKRVISQEAPKIISRVKHLADGLKEFEKCVYMLPSSNMMDMKSYGKINKKYWEQICNCKRDVAIDYITRCDKLLNSKQFDEIFKLNIDRILECVWFFATEKIFSASDFQKAESVFSRIYRFSHADVIIADLYSKKKVGGEDVLRDPIHNLLKGNYDSQKLTLIASGLMWMNAYQSENVVLQHMLTTGKEMTVKAQERLHSLTNGGDKASNGFDVKSSNNSLYFDVSALAWKDEEYIGLFENLAFQDRTLTYSLAIREENKDLFIAQGLNVPSRQDILKKFKDTFVEEYGSNVTTQEANCIALSGSGEEKMDGILVTSNECKQMGILIHVARIGKKLIIKFYTLFMPTGSDLPTQKQQALSMYKKLSPSVTMWESSLKDTMLMAVEQLLNAGVATGTTQPENVTESGDIDSNGPIF